MLNRPLKKLGGKEADEVDTNITVLQSFATTFENTTQTIINRLESKKMMNAGRKYDKRTGRDVRRGFAQGY